MHVDGMEHEIVAGVYLLIGDLINFSHLEM